MKIALLVCVIGLQPAILPAMMFAHEHHEQHDATAGLHDVVIDEKEAAEIEANLDKLSPEDRGLAEAQGFCPVMTDSPLGAMGAPIKLMVGDEAVFLCCKGCQKQALAHPEKTLATLNKLKAMVEEQREIAANLAELAPEDRKLAMAQGYCAVMTDSPLGSMGAPIKVSVNNQPVFVCCKGCSKKAQANPDKTLKTVAQLKEKVAAAKDIEASFANLKPSDRGVARAQGHCAVMIDSPLGSMGVPVKLLVGEQPVFLCCAGCRRKALANPDQTLATVAELKKKVAAETSK